MGQLQAGSCPYQAPHVTMAVFPYEIILGLLRSYGIMYI